MKWISLLFLALSVPTLAANHVEISKDELIVKFKKSIMNQYSFEALDVHQDVSSFMSAVTGVRVNKARFISKSPDALLALVKVPTGQSLPSVAQKMARNSRDVKWILPNRIYHGEYREEVPNDPQIAKQYHLKQIEAFNAFKLHLGRPDVVIAVTDDGFDLDHEDLRNSWHVNSREIPDNGIDDDNNGYIDDVVGWNFNNKNNNPDWDGRDGAHGTHIAGIINATPNNGVGVTGVAPGIKIMPLKFYGSARWSSVMILETYTYAVDNGAKIITTSYNINAMSRDPIYREAVQYAHDNNVLVFNSAGNGNDKDPERSRMDTLLLVSSLDASASEKRVDVRSSFSNYGYQVDISAPGGNIMATGTNNRYVNMSGTSMATPMAAAIAGLIWSAYPELTVRQVLHTLLVSVDDISAKNTRYIDQLGTGRINARKAVDREIEPLQIYVPGLKNVGREFRGVLKGNQIKLRFHGAPGKAQNPIKIISKTNYREVRRDMPLQQVINLGTNQLTYKFDALPAGEYRLVVPEDAFLDPFDRPLDGDFDGQPGGHMMVDFTVQ